MFDKDKDGVIKVDELEMVMKLLDQNMTKKEVRDMFNEADADGNAMFLFENLAKHVFRARFNYYPN